MKKHSKVKLRRYLIVFVVLTCLMSYSFAMLSSHAISYSDAVASVDRLSSLPFSSFLLRYLKNGITTDLVQSDFTDFPVHIGDDIFVPASSRLYLYVYFDDPVYFCLDYKYHVTVTVNFNDFGWFTDSLSYFSIGSASVGGIFSSVSARPSSFDGSSTYHFVVDFSDEDLRSAVFASSEYDPSINSVETSCFMFIFSEGYSSADYTISPSFSIDSVSVTRESAELKSNFLFDLWRYGSGMIMDTINIIASQPMLVALLCALPMVGVGIGLFRRVKNA